MPGITIIDILEYAKKQLHVIPPADWKGTSHSGADITVTGHSVGIDLSRGPWVKFHFTEGGEAREIQGFRTWNHGDRIKFGPDKHMKECDSDKLAFTGALDAGNRELDVIVRFSFDQDENPFVYRFVGKSTGINVP